MAEMSEHEKALRPIHQFGNDLSGCASQPCNKVVATHDALHRQAATRMSENAQDGRINVPWTIAR
jgi:hypothetical protein